MFQFVAICIIRHASVLQLFVQSLGCFLSEISCSSEIKISNPLRRNRKDRRYRLLVKVLNFHHGGPGAEPLGGRSFLHTNYF